MNNIGKNPLNSKVKDIHKMHKQLIIAHRGESFNAPENTLSSINLAWENGADAVEVDIRLTKDNQVVVIHDAHTWRVSRKFRWISNTELKELKKLDVGESKDIKYKGERIPTLKEVLNTVPNGKKILIEIKSERKIIPYLKNVINNSALQTNQIEIISFTLGTLIEVRKQLPKFSVFWILALDYSWIRKFFRPSINRIILKAIKYNMNGLDLWAGRMLDSEVVKKIKSAELKLYTWTVNNPEKAKTLFDMGVDGITTDKAKWLKDQLKSFKR
ncbi:MAG: glycerophosphodiester phosphodiesterase [Bacteroidales bacterium]|nr:glycerophosphodiester phosphodiesterase [Bacteroidales bacterium]